MRFHYNSVSSFTRSRPSWCTVLLTFLLGTIIVIAWPPSPHSAQLVPIRIGVIDTQKILTQSVAGKASFAKLKRMQEERIEKAKQLDQEVQQLDKQRISQSSSLSQAQNEALEIQIAEKRTAVQRYAQDADKEVTDAHDREVAALEAKLKPTVDGLGKELSLAAIFKKVESGVVYVGASIDLTDTVITRFDAASAPAGTPK